MFLWHISVWGNSAFSWFKEWMFICLTSSWLHCKCNRGADFHWRGPLTSDETWQASAHREIGAAKPFRSSQALHIIVDFIIAAPPADGMGNISHRSSYLTENVFLWRATEWCALVSDRLASSFESTCGNRLSLQICNSDLLGWWRGIVLFSAASW